MTDPIRLKESEADFGKWFEDYLDLKGHLWTHFKPAQWRGKTFTALSGRKGFPDYAIVTYTAPSRFVTVELKSTIGTLSPDQREWRDGLSMAGVEWHCFHPKDRDEIMRIL